MDGANSSSLNPRLEASAFLTALDFPAKKLKSVPSAPSASASGLNSRFAPSAPSTETGLNTLIEGGASDSSAGAASGSADSPKKLSSIPACFSAAGAPAFGKVISTVLIERPPFTKTAEDDFLISRATF